MHNTDSFISYRRSASMHLARNIFTELHRRSINAFLDVENIDATRFDTFILNQIAARPNYVLVLSKGALLRCTEPGDWLLRELQHAVNLDRNIIPVWDVGFDWEAEKTYLPDVLHFIGLRNAVSFSHSYYRGFIDQIARFIRNPQDHGDIRIIPAPQTEAEEAQKSIREALAIDGDEMVIKAIVEYHQRKSAAQTSSDWEALLDLWSQIRSYGSLPLFFQLDAEEKILREELEKQRQIENKIQKRRMYATNRIKDYDFIRKLSQNPNISQDYISNLLEEFWKAYPQDGSKYDPDDLSGERAKAAAALLRREKAKAEYVAQEKVKAQRLAREKAEAQRFSYKQFAWVKIPNGNGTMLTDNKIMLSIPTEDYLISKYPVTNAQYSKFIEAGGYYEWRWWTDDGWEIRHKQKWHQPAYWQDNQWNSDAQPVIGVSWYEAVAFCLWLSDVIGGNVMLPTETQWQYAAQGGDGRKYPWGNKWNSVWCNNRDPGGLFSIFKYKPVIQGERTTSVTAYEGNGNSPFGVVDMVGNVWEYCLTDYENLTNNFRSLAIHQVLRGGSWSDDRGSTCVTSRSYLPASDRNNLTGFRLVFHPSFQIH